MSEPVGKSSAAPFRDPPPEVVQELEQAGIAPGSYEFRPLDAVRRTIARRMSESFREAPHFGLTAKLEVDRLLALRRQLNERPGARISFNDMLIKACALALQAAPEANASFTSRGIVYHRHADVAVAVAFDGGLVTPILRCAETKRLDEIAVEMRDLAQRGRNKRLKPDEYFGGTFTLSNLGMFGISSFTSILNAPQGCILSVGEPEKTLRFGEDGDSAVRALMHVTLTCDHRVVDGVTGARFLQALRTIVEAPEGLAD